ncbi:ester cyclase [Micromonosporaceae bacterium Da 78-11]
MRGSLLGTHATFPDLRITIEAIYVAGDTVTVRTTYRGTQAGPILGVPATGRTIEFRATDIHQIGRGQIVRTDHLEDLFGLYSQITAK